MRTAKTLIRLVGGRPGWSESSLDAQPFCWFCHVASQMVWQLSFASHLYFPISIVGQYKLSPEAEILQWACAGQNQENDLCAQQRQISLGIRPVWSVCCQHEESLGLQLPMECTEKTDQTGQMPRLIWVLIGHTCHFVGFVMRQLILEWHNNKSGGVKLCTHQLHA